MRRGWDDPLPVGPISYFEMYQTVRQWDLDLELFSRKKVNQNAPSQQTIEDLRQRLREVRQFLENRGMSVEQ